jgi:hypothetical protein
MNVKCITKQQYSSDLWQVKRNCIVDKLLTISLIKNAVRLSIVNRREGLEGRQTSKFCKLIDSRCWKGTSRDNPGASNSEITRA